MHDLASFIVEQFRRELHRNPYRPREPSPPRKPGRLKRLWLWPGRAHSRLSAGRGFRL